MSIPRKASWISPQGVVMPRILYGTAWKKDRTAGLVELAIEQGFRGIDTACQPKHYDEAGVGAGLAAALTRGVGRGDIYLQSKFTPLPGQDPARVPYDPAASLSEQVAQSFARSQANLGTEILDGLVLHSPLAGPAALKEVWSAMERLVDSGGVRQLGISNCYDPARLQHLYEEARIKPAVVQNRFYAQTGHDRVIRAFCRAHGLFYQSFWTLTANPDILAHDVVKGLMEIHGLTAPQVLFAYLSQQGVIPLTGTTSALHMRQDLEAVHATFSEEECASLAALLR